MEEEKLYYKDGGQYIVTPAVGKSVMKVKVLELTNTSILIKFMDTNMTNRYDRRTFEYDYNIIEDVTPEFNPYELTLFDFIG